MLQLACTIALAITGTLLTLVAFGPLIRSPRWWIRALDFPRLQFAFLLAVVIALWLVLWRSGEMWRFAPLLVFAGGLAYQASLILPYTILGRRHAGDARAGVAEAAPRIRLLIANVLMENRESGRLLAAIDAHDPDVVLLVETDAWWIEALAPLLDERPHHVLRPMENTYGMALYSRFPLHDAVVRELIDEGVPSIRAEVEVAPGVQVTLFGIHPPPPWPEHAEASTPRDAELVVVAREVAKIDSPVIVAGDLNDVAWSRTTTMFRRISRLLDPRRGRGFYNSFNARNPIARWPLDHVFFSEGFSLVALRRLPAFGSDHFPILVELALATPVDPHERPEPADEQVRELADAKLEAL